MATPKVKVSEANVSRAIRDLLTAKKIYWLRMNSSAQKLEYTSKRTGVTSTRVLRGHKSGTADLLAFVDSSGAAWAEGDLMLCYHRVVWIEVKAPGKTQSAEQIEFQRDVTEYGMTYLVADSVDTVIEWLKARGL